MLGLSTHARAALCTLFSLFLYATPSIAQMEQMDSTMNIKRFSYEDLDSERFEKYKKSSSTNRLAENPDDLTQEVIIIDGDEIRKFGHTTLVDVLKTIPGFRTSQPGNAIEGETFLMRGLLGNDHTKILINGIPIKPEAVKSMPIAAQLPIRHAEYIEIVQGPSSATYGSDAMGGVINIVLPEVDRPVFAWADISGVSPATTDINLTLGGKAGKGKNVLNYQIFASSQSAATVNLRIPRDSILVLPGTLNPLEMTYFLPDKDDSIVPEINGLLRESRLIGGNFQYRGFELFATSMFRSEHSGFGSSPLAMSYSDPSTLTGENIYSVGMRYVHDNKRRFSSRTSLSALYYQTIEDASYIAIRDSLSPGRNYIFARSLDLRGDYQGIMRFSDQFKMAFGATGQYSVSNPYTSYLGRRFHLEQRGFTFTGKDLNPRTTAYYDWGSDSLGTIDTTTWIPRYDVINVATFAHFLYKSKNGKMNLEAATRVDYNTSDGFRFTPQFGVVYRPIERLKLVLNYGRGHRAPRSYNLYNNYWQALSDIQNPPPMSSPEQYYSHYQNNAVLTRRLDTLSTEFLEGGEVRAVWDALPNLRLHARYYLHLMQNRLTRFSNITPPPPGPGGVPPQDSTIEIGYGYFNNKAAGSYSFLQAGMVTIEYRQDWQELSLRVMGSYEIATGYEEIEEAVVQHQGQTTPVSIERSTDYRFMPRHSSKVNVSLAYKGFTFSVHNNIFVQFTSDIYLQGLAAKYQEFGGMSHNLDLFIHKELFRQLNVFGAVYNVFNSYQYGIQGASLSNSWNFNPQYGRIFKIGLSFQLN